MVSTGRKYSGLLVIQTVFWFLYVIFRDHVLIQNTILLFTVVVFSLLVLMMKSNRLLKRLTAITGLLGVLGPLAVIILHISGHYVPEIAVISRTSYALFLLSAILAIGHNVFITDKVTSDQIIGAICIYILIATFFASIYAAIGAVYHGSLVFTFGADAGPLKHVAQYMYYSITVLTTAGTGDVVPTHPSIRFVTSLEQLTGPIYLAIMMARLVGMHLSQKR